ncbi:MAG: hypothetical protein WBV80_14040 [Mycobacterium sp.]
MTWPLLRLLSRSPLIRASDRIETAVGTLAVLFVVIATACAGVAGTMIHDIQAQKYLEQTQTRHAVVARAVDDSELSASSETTAFAVHARWRVNGVEHSELLGWNRAVTVGAPLDIWVDDQGNRVAPPRPVTHAAVDALSAAVVGWFIVILALAQAVNAVRAHARRMRNAQWEQDLRTLVGEDGGRTNRPQ